ncbi:MAG: HAD-IA family hydrolase [Actinobacteria bacterium]|nr:HAD-IA family hydrolase [Actinomycetota bacterium]
MSSNSAIEARSTNARNSFSWERFDAVLFDLDGVITPTAEIHEHAWAKLFEAYDYTPADYLEHIDGRPRYDGVRTFLTSRGVSLPDGNLDDAPGTDSVCAMGNKKNALFTAILERDGIAAYPGSLSAMDHLERHKVPMAIVSSSRNAVSVLSAAGLVDRFPIVVDGLVAADRGLAGKPAPDSYLLGASLLNVSPGNTVVVEDAVSGVAAGAAGNFGVVIGVDRGAGHAALMGQGATFVVDDLADLVQQGATP